MTQERIKEIIAEVPKIIIDREKIPNSNDYRVTKYGYFAEDGIIFEGIIYKNSVNSAAWAAEIKRNIYEPSVSDIPTYRSIAIQDHPSLEGVTRTIDLADLQITKDAVRSTSLIKHSNEIPDILIIMWGDNTSIIETEDGYVGERDYWDILTQQGLDPYTLWDARMQELDSQNRFNNIY